MSNYKSPPPLTWHAGRLKDRVIFVTGASSGIGSAAVRLFAEEGAKVVLGARRRDMTDMIVKELSDGGHEAMAVTCDVRSEDSVAEAIDATVARFGRLDGALNNAGIAGAHGPLHTHDMSRYDDYLQTNLRGVFLCIKYEVMAMLETGGGAIVNTNSAAGLKGAPNNSLYCSTKWGITGLTRAAALDYADHNIRVNGISPGPVYSEIMDKLAPDEAGLEAMAARFPIRHIAHPDDPCRAALFLLSDEARWTTGVTLACDGGITL